MGNEESKKITPEMQKAMDKHGGLLPMNLTDADTGETLYNNLDATAMAKQNAKRGGKTASNYKLGTDNSIYLKCYICNERTVRSFEQLFDIGWGCGCGANHDPIDAPGFLNLRYKKYSNVFESTEEESKVEEWYNNRFRLLRYKNIIKNIPEKTINYIKKMYNKIHRKFKNLAWAIEVIKYNWKRE